jgi:pyruvate,water dikinase
VVFQKLARFFHRRPSGSVNEFRDLFERFQRILRNNNQVLALISELDDKFSGEYIFDINYLEQVVTKLSQSVHLVISDLNVIAGNRYRELFSRQSAIEEQLKEILEGHSGAGETKLTLDYSDMDSEIIELTGGKNARLGEIRNHLKMRTPNGFVISTDAYRKFMEYNDLFSQIRALYQKCTQDGGCDEKTYNAAIDKLFTGARFPDELSSDISDRLSSLRESHDKGVGLAIRSSAHGEDTLGRTFAGQFESFLNCPFHHVLPVCARVIASRWKLGALTYGGPQVLDEDQLPMALGVQQMIAAHTSGVAYSVEPSGESPDSLAISATYGLGSGIVSGLVDSDYYIVSKLDPTKVTSRRIVHKTIQMVPARGLGVTSSLAAEEVRDRSCLSESQIVEVAEAALMLDRYFKRPVDIEWCFDADGQLYILQCRPLEVSKRQRARPVDRTVALAQAPVLMRKRGDVAQRGIAAGRVRHVQEEDDPGSFPMGAIAVTRYTTPRLSSIIRKAAAIITDIGSPTGHMATVAREFGVPMIVNTTNGTALLPDGSEVTVDAEENVVYGGVIKDLLAYEAEAEDVYRDLREYRILRQLFRRIAPLYLIDPNSTDFTARNCRTYHDIARFSHEKAVKVLIDLNVSSRRFRGVETREFKLDIPLGLHVVDMGGGFEPEPGSKYIDSIDSVRCRPLRALLAGLVAPGTWSTQPVQLGFGDLVSSLTRFSMTDRVAEYQGQNLAVVTAHYANISLRLGYHFNVIDTYVSESVDDNYVYFRFVGGVTETERRHLRAVLLKEILQRLDFNVTVNADLVVARLKKLGAKELESVLTEIGRLIGFTRQLDTQMVSEDSVGQGVQAFFEHRSELQ